jgi:hypothetical protein
VTSTAGISVARRVSRWKFAWRHGGAVVGHRDGFRGTPDMGYANIGRFNGSKEASGARSCGAC